MEGVIWYLLYSPATQNNGPDSYLALSQWHIDGSYGSAANCAAAHRSDLSALQGRLREEPTGPPAANHFDEAEGQGGSGYCPLLMHSSRLRLYHCQLVVKSLVFSE
jgi:hypothetical protein